MRIPDGFTPERVDEVVARRGAPLSPDERLALLVHGVRELRDERDRLRRENAKLLALLALVRPRRSWVFGWR